MESAATVAEMNDGELQKLVDACKKNRLERTLSEMSQDQEGRVFVNRSVSMERIKYIGFDMDHTLVVYRSPEYDILSYEMALDRLVEVGYPAEIKDIKYDRTIPVRGLFFDKETGNLLKLDSFGNILSCWHGLKMVAAADVRQMYPNKYVQANSKTIFNLDTLFHISETYLLAVLVDYFDNHKQYCRVTDGAQYGDIKVTYNMMQQDVRNAIDYIHNLGNLKQRTLDNLDLYVKKDPRLPAFLDKLRESGRTLFIATNSGFQYTQRIMTYLLGDGKENNKNWKSYFSYIIVDAKKPLFFQEGTTLRAVDEDSGSLRLGVFTGPLSTGNVFSGGSSDAFCKIAGAQGKEVLYVGDHIFGDIIKSKQEQAFRTFLVIPELTSEIESWEANRALFVRLQNLEFLLAEMYQRVGSDNVKHNLPSITALKKALKETAESIENGYPQELGSLLRCGSRLTYFANQVMRFADLYSSTCVNLVNYPNQYLFNSPHQLMAHESSRSRPSSSKVSPIDGEVPSSPVIRLNRLKGNYFGQSVIDFDLDEEYTNGSNVHLSSETSQTTELGGNSED